MIIFKFSRILIYYLTLQNIQKFLNILKLFQRKKILKNLCKLRNIDNIDKLPKIQLSDPLANFYGYRIGQIFEFKKYSKNSGVYIYYRVCV